MAKKSTPAKKSAAPAAAKAKGNGKKPAAVAKKKPAAAGDVGAAISASWADPKVRAARTERTAVKTGGVEYSSVPAAFVALGLPMGRMVRFRKLLKAEGTATFEKDDGSKAKFTAVAA